MLHFFRSLFKDQSGFAPILVLVLLLGLFSGGYYAYKNPSIFSFSGKSVVQFAEKNFGPKEALAQVAEEFTKIKTLHADLDTHIKMSMMAHSFSATNTETETKMTGFVDMDLETGAQKMHTNLVSGALSSDIDSIILTKEKKAYMKMSMLGNKWVELDMETMEATAAGLKTEDYAKQTTSLLNSFKEDGILKLEDEVVEGIKTEHYRVDISNDKYLALLNEGGGVSEQVQKSIKNAALKTDFWINPTNHYPVKIRSEIKNQQLFNEKGEQISSSDMVMTILYSKFNQPVTIVKPEGEIVKFGDLQKSLPVPSIPPLKAPKKVSPGLPAPMPTFTPYEETQEYKDFMKKFDEMGQHNAEMQKKVEENQKKFCEEHPSLC